MKLKKRKQERLENILKALNPEIECRWLKKLSKKEIDGLWIALMSLQDDENLIRF